MKYIRIWERNSMRKSEKTIKEYRRKKDNKQRNKDSE